MRDTRTTLDTQESLEAPRSDLVGFICVDRRHQEVGRGRPDGSGHLSLSQGSWAYCTAGLDEEPHVWSAIAPRRLSDIHHADQPDGAG